MPYRDVSTKERKTLNATTLRSRQQADCDTQKRKHTGDVAMVVQTFRILIFGIDSVESESNNGWLVYPSRYPQVSRRIILFSAKLFCGLIAACAISLPSFAEGQIEKLSFQRGISVEVLSESPLKVDIRSSPLPTPHFEGPPLLVNGDSRLVVVSTAYAYLCINDSVLSTLDRNHLSACSLISVPGWINDHSGDLQRPSAEYYKKSPWAVNHNGVVFAQRISPSQILTVNYGENKNEARSGMEIHSTVNPDVPVVSCYSGEHGEGYKDCWEAYNGFVTAHLLTFDKERLVTDEDKGPIVWPSCGYLDDSGRKASMGVRHPSAIMNGQDLYIFWIDTCKSPASGSGGLKVGSIRVTGSSLGSLMPLEEDADKISSGPLWKFNASSFMDFLKTQGPKSNSLWPQDGSTIKFNVAKSSSGQGFIGVEERLDQGKWGIYIRTSPDLVHWSVPLAVPNETMRPSYDDGDLHYPTFLSIDGLSQTRIDLRKFYLIGTCKGGMRKLLIQISF